jgi:uncharacterized protein YndB with AHSA1/START domain
MPASESNSLQREVVITRILDAPRDLVFRAWTEPRRMQRWFGPKHFTNPVCELDVRVGGAWQVVMQGPDGTQYPCGGVYREIVPPERLVFTNIALDAAGKPLLDGLTTVTFAEQDGKTKLTLTTRMTGLAPHTAPMLEGMEAGWSQSLDKLAETLADGRAAAGGDPMASPPPVTR